MNTLETLIANYEIAKLALQEHKDGFLYIIETHSYGYHHRTVVNNSHELNQITNKYNGDNGFTSVYTNNPDIHAWRRDSAVIVYKPKYAYLDTTSIDSGTDLEQFFDPCYAEEPDDEDRLSEQEWKDVHGHDELDPTDTYNPEC